MAPVVRGAGGGVTAPSVTRIVVTGSESTGKTTLARDLAGHFSVLWVREQAREYAERVRRSLTAEDVSPIASEQIAAEDAAMTEANHRGDRWLVLDTDLVSTVVYARHYYGSCPSWIEAEARARLAELYLVADIDIEWQPDSVRDRPAARDELDQAFRNVLREFGARSCHVRGHGELRLASALHCIATSE
jgi:NadR type nicotinamide-nucleotide adenylyltransferase